MQEAVVVLDVLRERGRKGLPFTQLYRQMFNKELYLLAYGNIYSNQGAMTPGAGAETADGMSEGKIDQIIEAMRHERYRFSPARRVYIVRREALCCIPNYSWEELGGSFLGLMANLDLKSDGNSSMPGKQRLLKASKVGRCGARVISVKAGLLEAQSSDGEYAHPPERRMTPVPRSASAWNVGQSNLQSAGDAQRGH